MQRRRVIALSGAAIGGAMLASSGANAARPDRIKPQAGDVLVHAFGDHQGKVIVPDEITREEKVFAFPRSPEGVIRDGSLHNQVSLLRVDAAAMSDKTRRYAAGPLIAVSAACTHTGCEVSGWQPDTNELVCPCHGSTFNVLDAARVVLGPATKPLAYLPIEVIDDTIAVAGKFSRRVGPEPQF
jgi:Rieske Fe-S protein